MVNSWTSDAKWCLQDRHRLLDSHHHDTPRGRGGLEHTFKQTNQQSSLGEKTKTKQETRQALYRMLTFRAVPTSHSQLQKSSGI